MKKVNKWKPFLLIYFFIFKADWGKMWKKSCFSGTSAVFRSVSSCQGGTSRFIKHLQKKQKKKNRNSLTDSHLMDTSRCCHRNWFSSRWTKMSQPGAPIAGCSLLTQSPAQHASSEWRWRLQLCANPSFDLSFATEGAALMFAGIKYRGTWCNCQNAVHCNYLLVCSPQPHPLRCIGRVTTSAILHHTSGHPAGSGG